MSRRSRAVLWVAICLGIAAGGTWAGYALALRVVGAEPTTTSHFGDAFGGVAAFFSALAGLLVAYTLFTHASDQETRDEQLERTLRAMEELADAQRALTGVSARSSIIAAKQASMNRLNERLRSLREESSKHRADLEKRRKQSANPKEPIDEHEAELRREATSVRAAMRNAVDEIEQMARETRELMGQLEPLQPEQRP